MRGQRLDQLVTVKDHRGITSLIELPPDAKPPCPTCEKPELTPDNLDVVLVYSFAGNQQQVSEMSGHWRGMRLEAVLAALNYLWEAGKIRDRDLVMERIWTLDAINVRIHNAKVDANQAASKSK